MTYMLYISVHIGVLLQRQISEYERYKFAIHVYKKNLGYWYTCPSVLWKTCFQMESTGKKLAQFVKEQKILRNRKLLFSKAMLV